MPVKHDIFGLLIFALLLLLNCSNDEVEGGIDCQLEQSHFQLNHSINTKNIRLVSFDLNYRGEYLYKGISRWDFGDGTIQDITSKTLSHTFSTPGTYTITVRPSLENETMYCEPLLTTTLIIK
ncbi:PKD domain-containing protein [Formosa sp. S-31]|uniref:PKD domain-containing protein n=1 Tax=Formosa sp. S-31 TaxID=2790949 RepID=UPI003EBB4375